MLPAEIVLLLFTVAYPKRRDVRANLAEGTVPEGTAEDYLPGTCGREPVCLSRGIWARVQSAILGVLDSTTLDDLFISEALQHAAAQFVPLDALGANPPRKGEFAHA